MYDEHTLTYLQLFLLREPSNPFPGGRLTHEGHDPDQRLVAVQHLCDLLHALAEGREDHDACADLSRRLRLCTNHSRVQSSTALTKRTTLQKSLSSRMSLPELSAHV